MGDGNVFRYYFFVKRKMKKFYDGAYGDITKGDTKADFERHKKAFELLDEGIGLIKSNEHYRVFEMVISECSSVIETCDRYNFETGCVYSPRDISLFLEGMMSTLTGWMTKNEERLLEVGNMMKMRY